MLHFFTHTAHIKKYIGIAFAAFLLSCFPVDMVLAQTQNAGEPAAAVAQFLSIIINVITFFLMLMINYMGDLFGVDLIIGEAPMQVIRPMWVVIRNITNIVFIGILMFLVFSNLFGISNWSVKEKLPKVIIALVVINFSLLAGKVALDFVNVGTMTVLSIPQDVMREKGQADLQSILTQGYSEKDEDYCTTLTQNANGPVATPPLQFQTGGTTYPNHFKGDEECAPFYARMNWLMCRDTYDSGSAKNKDSCLFYLDPSKFKNSMLPASSMAGHNLMNAFAVYVFRLEELPKLAGQVGNWDGVVTNVIFSTIMALAFMVAMFAAFGVMLIRVVFFWIVLVFSPVVIALEVMGFGSIKGLGLSDIVKYLLVPIKLAAVFAVTYIMMSAMVEFGMKYEESKAYMVIGPSLSVFGAGLSGILWQIATAGIFWVGAFWALDGTFADKFVGWVKDTALNFGKIAAGLAILDRPILPGAMGPNGKPMTMRSLQYLDDHLGNVVGGQESAARQFWNKKDSKSSANQATFDQMRQNLQNASNERERAEAVRDAIKTTGLNHLRNRTGANDFKNKLTQDVTNVISSLPSFQRLGTGTFSAQDAAELVKAINANRGYLGSDASNYFTDTGTNGTPSPSPSNPVDTHLTVFNNPATPYADGAALYTAIRQLSATLADPTITDAQVTSKKSTIITDITTKANALNITLPNGTGTPLKALNDANTRAEIVTALGTF